MILAAALAVILGSPASAAAADAAPPAARATPEMQSLSLVEALTAVDRPELAGVFTYVSEADAPHAFAGLLARDKKALKRYAGKINADLKDAGGLTAWDHEVCAMLVNLYAGALGPVVERPSAKLLKAVNECVLSPVMTLQDVASRRKK